MDEIPNHETGIHQIPRGEHRHQRCRPQQQNFLLDASPEVMETKTKRNYWDFIEIQSFARQTVDKTQQSPYRMGEGIGK